MGSRRQDFWTLDERHLLLPILPRPQPANFLCDALLPVGGVHADHSPANPGDRRPPGRVIRSKSSPKDFSPPWLHCLQALEAAQPGEEASALERALAGLPNQTELLQTILGARPGYRPPIPSLAEIASDLQPIEWVWPGWIPRSLITVLGASQGSGKSFVATDLAYRIVHNKGYPDGCADRPAWRQHHLCGC